jgi:hypothetical protein
LERAKIGEEPQMVFRFFLDVSEFSLSLINRCALKKKTENAKNIWRPAG